LAFRDSTNSSATPSSFASLSIDSKKGA
jgi:hypothetical protein